ncbi:4-hydroxy-tetrahydrodipicolinate reductase [Haematospirillum sp. H1815]|uniref:4-hydroxy-tetrahydrodipicolinate reductase n=1 Tax=Haematospirillum sp. H1815 TaxID=2723108 RepID=UPI00143988EB|nr:4-hydroxy-tetrahydrodipicolinate reductase [Haematospirillum sp. H1815]NKD76941.1 4-hydroxy-tetrahydrodipicolinate reductase [Haematospirillum sp. H1815]
MKIAVAGCAGRMGRMLVQEILAADTVTLAGGTEPQGSPFLGQDIGRLVGTTEPLGIAITDDPSSLFSHADAVIDFTTPDATTVHARLAATHRTALIVGTTGFSPTQQEAVSIAAKSIPIVMSPNMSIGTNLLFALTERVAAILGLDYDIEILEMHHRHKVDAPSGTALGLGQAAARGRRTALDDVSQITRNGHTGARTPGTIGFASLRGGDVIGEHSVIFAADGERVELTHKASSRQIFARGAIRAARWCNGRRPGLYSMQDVLGLTPRTP